MSRPLRVAINTLTTTARKAGVGEYIAGLIETLPRLAPDWEFVVLTARDNRHFFRLDQSNVREIPVPLAHDPFWTQRPLYLLWQQFALPRLLRREKVDLIHHPNTMLVRRGRVPAVITVHDMADWRIPGKYSRLRTLFRKRAVRVSVRTCERTIAVSEHARGDLVAFAGADPDRVVVTHEGFSPRFVRPTESVVEAFRRERGIERPFVLYVGTLQASKNVETLVRAVALARRERPELRLVLAGKDGNGVAAIEEALGETGGREWTDRLGYVSDADIPLWYAAADLVAYPSLFEGFGLPVLEAQGAGTPILCSDVASLPEVAGDGALLLPPLEAEAWAGAIGRILSDTALRSRLVASGRANLARFDADEVGRRVLSVYRAAAGG